ncbi:hypothetical protein DFH28DRAFT_888838 [Melampsora americana]|nr:hypothetical protein DFH28DRAFT_888838 [Melampsora americana]
MFCDKHITEFMTQNSEMNDFYGHKVLITSTFEIIANAQPRFPVTSDPPFFHSTVSISNAERGLTQYALKGYPNNGSDADIMVDGLYCLTGRLLAVNEDGPTTLMYHNNGHLLSRSVRVPEAEFVNQTHVSSLGVVMEVIQRKFDEPSSHTILMVRHRDYDRINNRYVNFVVEYNLASTCQSFEGSNIICRGIQISIIGRLVGRNDETNVWVVQVSHYLNIRYTIGTYTIYI